MSYQEKRTLTTMISSGVVLAFYIQYVMTQYTTYGEALLTDLAFWAKAMLFAIAGCIGVVIATQILFHILLSIGNEIGKEVSKAASDSHVKINFEPEEIPKSDDEMDKLIDLKASRNGYVVNGVGFILALITLLVNIAPAIMLNIIFISFWMAMFVTGGSQMYFYRRGL